MKINGYVISIPYFDAIVVENAINISNTKLLNMPPRRNNPNIPNIPLTPGVKWL